MNVYQLKELPEEYKELQLDLDDLFDALGEEHLMTIHFQRSKNTSLLPIWKTLALDFEDVLGKNSKEPDVSLWASTYLVLNSRAYSVLSDVLKNEGEFLPISIGEESGYIFNCLAFGQEDTAVCTVKYLDGIEDGLETLYFDEDDVQERLLFKSKMQGCQALYATEKFRDICAKYQLQGLRFEDDLLAVF
ncbi:TPA: hypothetical protein RQL13_003592 [Vibrio vulnificus]|nr:hypothetical protein [Vibrio vulnificus]HDY8201226.1 hypothetical protein [Vibrio vulnificus]